MLTEKLVSYFKKKDIWYDDVSNEYKSVLDKLNIPETSSFYHFFMKVDDGATFYNRNFEIYHICWFMINSDDLEILMNNLWENRPNKKLPKNYIPFSPFEAEKVLLYDILTDNVYFSNEGDIDNIIDGTVEKPDWNSFNEFLEWYFEIE